jgi:hypothetical protein
LVTTQTCGLDLRRFEKAKCPNQVRNAIAGPARRRIFAGLSPVHLSAKRVTARAAATGSHPAGEKSADLSLQIPVGLMSPVGTFDVSAGRRPWSFRPITT